MKINKPAIFLLIICIIFSFTCYSQQTGEKIVRNSVYADFASRGAYYSVNYDRLFRRGEKLNWSYRVGLCLMNNVIAMPLGLQAFTGHNEHHAEFSITVVPYIEKYTKLFSAGNLSDKKIFVIPGVGYRYQRPGGGIFFRIVAAPVIYLDPPSDNFWNMDPKIYAGITGGIGFSF